MVRFPSPIGSLTVLTKARSFLHKWPIVIMSAYCYWCRSSGEDSIAKMSLHACGYRESCEPRSWERRLHAMHACSVFCRAPLYTGRCGLCGYYSWPQSPTGKYKVSYFLMLAYSLAVLLREVLQSYLMQNGCLLYFLMS